MSELLLFASLVAGLYFGKRSIGGGVAAVVFVGSVYGILRANFLDTATFFVYDAAVAGLYISRLPMIMERRNNRKPTFPWAMALIVWPIAYLSVGVVFPQHLVVQLVGLRSAIWYIPFIFIGSEMTARDVRTLGLSIAGTNLLVTAFGVAEFVFGLERFYPRNYVTELIYMSNDVAGFTAYRIPGTFSSAAAFGAYLVASFPLLVARLADRRTAQRERLLMAAGLLAAMIGTVMCGSRLPVVGLGFVTLTASYLLRRRPAALVMLAVCVAFAVYQIAGEERLQRFTSLADTDSTVKRLQVSANFGVLDVLATYPFGVGLGGAFGTNLPGFLAEYAIVPVGAENELARIALEQSVVGLGIWLAFVVWVFRKRLTERNDLLSYSLLSYIFFAWGTSIVGAGLLAGIPQTAMMLAYMGLLGSYRVADPTTGRGAVRGVG